MKKTIELLAPGGDLDSIKAAIAAGADAIYCGLSRFNARNRAENIDFQTLTRIIILAHKNNCKVFLTLNIIIIGDEIPALIGLLNQLVNTRIDGIIVQDFGVFYLVSNYFKGLKIHASTQLTTHNEGQIQFLKRLHATRVNLSRELSLDEIKALTLTAHENDLLTEVFVHGSYCISFSGICYISSVHGGKSGNRGRCSQPCRDRYLTTPAGKNFPLNLKDNSALPDLAELFKAGVDSIKIEGRIKKADYVYTVVNCWKKHLINFYAQNRLTTDNSDLYKVFNRDFSNGYLKGSIDRNMFIDNPRDHSIQTFAESGLTSSNETLQKKLGNLYEEKDKIGTIVRNKIKQFSIEKEPLIVSISGKDGSPLKVSVKTPTTVFILLSKASLVPATQIKSKSLANTFLPEQFKALKNTGYYINHLESENLESDLFLSFKEISSLKKKILSRLDGPEKSREPIDVPSLNKHKNPEGKPTLSVLISSPEDLYLCSETSAAIFFQLPDCLDDKLSDYIEFFLKNKRLIPWFPSILIGKHYTAAIKFLHQIKPGLIVTNNTGVAYEAFKQKIPWIAGPYLNNVNSFSLLCLKEKFNCHGAFISNEISRVQIKNIIPPENFELYYSLYHPLVLMTSRQCLFQQITGCEKGIIDDNCLQKCNKSSTINHLKNGPLFIEKSEGNYHTVYNNSNYLNTGVVNDFPDLFSGYFIDLRNSQTETKTELSKPGIIKLFTKLLDKDPLSAKVLNEKIYPSTNTQYKKGI